MINQTKQQTEYCLGLASDSSKKGYYEDDDIALKKEIEEVQNNALGLCTEKVLLARQAYELVSFLLSIAFLCVLYFIFTLKSDSVFSNLV